MPQNVFTAQSLTKIYVTGAVEVQALRVENLTLRTRLQSLAVPPEVARTLPKKMRELLGYNIYPAFVGYVDGRHPDRVLGLGPDAD